MAFEDIRQQKIQDLITAVEKEEGNASFDFKSFFEYIFLLSELDVESNFGLPKSDIDFTYLVNGDINSIIKDNVTLNFSYNTDGDIETISRVYT